MFKVCIKRVGYMNNITSINNPIIKEIKSLKLKKNREELGLFFIEGLRFVSEALMESWHVKYVLMSDSFASNENNSQLISIIIDKNIKSFVVTDKLFSELSETSSPQGILAVMLSQKFEVNDLIKNNSFIVILDSVQDPGNLGTIIRTADAAGAAGIIMSKGCVDLFNPKVLRSTMGSIFHLPIAVDCDLVKSIQMLKEHGIKTFAAHLSGEISYFACNLRDNCAIIVGNEANGISDDVAGTADFLVKIPMPGKAESLNASVAAGLLIYEALRQRLISC